MHENAPAGTYRRQARRNPLSDCPLTATFAAVGGKWKPTLVYWLAREAAHCSLLQRHAAPISHKVLVEQLRELEADGIVARIPLGAGGVPIDRLRPHPAADGGTGPRLRRRPPAPDARKRCSRNGLRVAAGERVMTIATTP